MCVQLKSLINSASLLNPSLLSTSAFARGIDIYKTHKGHKEYNGLCG